MGEGGAIGSASRLATAMDMGLNKRMEICPVFTDETGILSGTVSEQPVYGIGALVVPDTREITDQFYRLHFNFVSASRTERNRVRKEIRARGDRLTLAEVDRMMWSTRHHEYKFSEIARSNVQQYIDLIGLYFSFEGLEFHSLLVDRLAEGFSLEEWDNDDWKAYIDFTRQLLNTSLTRPAFAIVDLQGKPDSSPDYIEDALCSVEMVKGCLRATSDMSVYLQLVDVLVGCVQFDWKEQRGYYSLTSKRAQAKREVVSFVKSRLGMSRASPFMSSGKPFNIWDKPSVFSVRIWNPEEP